MTTIDAVLRFWFGDLDDPLGFRERQPMWFGSSEATDRGIEARFGATLAAARRGELADWAGSAQGRLALVIVVDQFSRNIHRGTPEAFAGDPAALALAREGVDGGDVARLKAVQQAFLLMPFMHAEDLEAQDEGVRQFARLAREAGPEIAEMCSSFEKYAHQHRDLVARFGRFPHRNALLGRASTPEEEAHLAESGESFGQSAR